MKKFIETVVKNRWNLRFATVSFLFLAPLALRAQQVQDQSIPPEQIEEELTQAEQQYQHALELFNPWYTGPLLTPSASMVPPGYALLQPYLFFTDNYGAFNEDRERVDAPNRFSISPQPVFLEIGITPSVDTSIFMGTIASWQQGEFSGGFQDINIKLGFLINKQGLYAPQAKFSIGQSFPTGAYNRLDPDNLGLDATGAGAWETSFTLTIAKLILWNTLHPVNTRISFGYTVSTPIKVENFNAYGGGYGTRGTVHPGNSFSADLGIEVSINEPWVVALDMVYNCTNRTTFSGAPGTTTPRGPIPASVGSGFSDQLSFAPAIEYNFSDSMGLIGGFWFTVYGRNASNFISGIFSWYWVFP